MSSTHSRNRSLKAFSTFAVLWICLLLCVTANSNGNTQAISGGSIVVHAK